MNGSSLSSETLHASCVARDGRAILIAGRSGTGKSDLALRLIDRGARLVSDDYTIVHRAGARLLASAPPTIAGKIEVRGIGIVEFKPVSDAPVCLLVDLDAETERLPERRVRIVAGIEVPAIALRAHEDSAPVKAELALDAFGLTVQ